MSTGISSNDLPVSRMYIASGQSSNSSPPGYGAMGRYVHLVKVPRLVPRREHAASCQMGQVNLA